MIGGSSGSSLKSPTFWYFLSPIMIVSWGSSSCRPGRPVDVPCPRSRPAGRCRYRPKGRSGPVLRGRSNQFINVPALENKLCSTAYRGLTPNPVRIPLAGFVPLWTFVLLVARKNCCVSRPGGAGAAEPQALPGPTLSKGAGLIRAGLVDQPGSMVIGPGPPKDVTDRHFPVAPRGGRIKPRPDGSPCPAVAEHVGGVGPT